MSENIQIGVEITTRGLAEAIQGFRELDKELEKKGVELRQVAAATEEVSTGMRIAGRPIGDITEAYKTLSTSTRETTKFSDDFTRQLAELGEIQGWSAEKTVAYGKSIQAVSEEWKQGAIDLKNVYEKEEAIVAVTRRMAAGNLAVTRTWRMVGREIFWTGLGSMFLVMSLARARRAVVNLDRSQRSWRDSIEDAKEAQRDLTSTLREWGPASEEARDANRRYERSLENVRYAEEAVRSAAEQQMYAWMMLALGYAPTVIRAIFSVTGLLWEQFIASTMAATGLDRTGVAAAMASGQLTMHIPILGIAITSYWQLAAAVAAATVGISLLVAGITFFATQTMVENQMRGIREEIERTTGAIKDFPVRSHSPMEVRTKWGGWSNLAELSELEPITSLGEIALEADKPRIDITTRVIVEPDMFTIKKKIDKISVRGKIARGGNY